MNFCGLQYNKIKKKGNNNTAKSNNPRCGLNYIKLNFNKLNINSYTHLHRRCCTHKYKIYVLQISVFAKLKKIHKHKNEKRKLRVKNTSHKRMYYINRIQNTFK